MYQYLDLSKSGRMAEKGVNDLPKASFSRGEHTLEIHVSLHDKSRKRLCDSLKETPNLQPGSCVVLQGGESTTLYCSDKENLFRQESYFHWLFGVQEPDFVGAVDVRSGKSYLFIPNLPEAYAIWMGEIHDKDHYKQKYGVDEVHFVENISKVLAQNSTKVILTLHGLNTDSGKMSREAVFEGIGNFEVDNSLLHPLIAECRVIKTPEEIRILKYANQISSAAHKEVMKRIRPGMKEYQCESIFQHYCYFMGGARYGAYTCICGTGHNASILHYGHAAEANEKTVNDGDMCLFDMGCEYYCYTSDITCSYPVNGRFTADQRKIYEAVLAASQAVMKALKPGISWRDMHHLAEREELKELKRHGLLVGDVDDMMKANLGSIFMPHGLGHFMGLDTHDVGGYPADGPSRPEQAGAKSLRTARIMKEGMVLTIEPGIYFINCLLDAAMKNAEQSKFLVAEEINRFRGFGGVRIEDDIFITADGMELMTVVPRSVEEIEALMAEGQKIPSDFPQQKFFSRH